MGVGLGIWMGGLAKLALEKASDSKLVIRMAMKLARIVDKKVG